MVSSYQEFTFCTPRNILSSAPIVVGYAQTSYTAREGQAVRVCVEMTSHPDTGAPRPFSLTLTTESGTARK